MHSRARIIVLSVNPSMRARSVKGLSQQVRMFSAPGYMVQAAAILEGSGARTSVCALRTIISTPAHRQLIRRGFTLIRSIPMWHCQQTAVFMISTLARRCFVKQQPRDLARGSRCISAQAPPDEYSKWSSIYSVGQAIMLERHDKRRYTSALALDPSRPQPMSLHVYDRSGARWLPTQLAVQAGIEHDCVLTVISWNINSQGLDPKARAEAILNHLEAECEKSPAKTAIMFQEVCEDSLGAILESPWVQRHFKLSDVAPPGSLYTEFWGDSFITKRLDWERAGDFNIMMVSKDLPVSNVSRIHFMSCMGRDALTMDIPLKNHAGLSETSDVVRLCTAHLSIKYMGDWCFRMDQKALVSKF